ncbi:glycosyltransferase family 4 protein [Ramlibacter sp. G-1-2-2]|uniref:Glycosyltransferase family 4 protein n=1 Tax=Ramlibacter agri TaxID=2728837 RepID=A0A848GZE4_9BURK|nr:glycosyltransferase [Ramlibacter agri]NML42702.1 glycosyltransferase family 4 protein [Ramlibacter agri]
MRLRRVLFDVTHTRTQADTAGISRTVRRLAEEFPGVAADAGLGFETVACAATGLRRAPLAPSVRNAASTSALLRFATGIAKPAIEQVLRLPWPLVRPIWQAAAGRAFDAAAAGLPAVDPRPGDLLLMVDGSWNYPVWPAARRARAQGAVVVPLIHDLMPIEAPEFCVPWVRNAFNYWLQDAVGTSDALLCNSASTEQALRAHAQKRGWRLPPTAHIRLGSDPAPQLAGEVRPALRDFLARPAPAYATVGSLEPKKNHRLLLRSCEALWAQGETFGLLVLGRRTPECADVAQRLAALAARGCPVLALHDANDAEIAYAYQHARALVLPSLFEGFGLPLVEARTRGCRVLASDIPAFRELADDGVRLFDPRSEKDLSDRLMTDAHSGAAGVVRAMPAWRWRECAAQSLERVQELLGRAAPGPAASAPITSQRTSSIAP